ncbi:MAG: hypothetical protein JOY81_13715 [Alphaproteobacteria bacterium]|nr:hypothetical protein [Alphaproteobacteria bacterium]
MNTEHPPKNDKELWQSLALGRPAAPAAVSDMEFAAWLEGNLPETEAARIEAAVAADPGLRLAAMDLADILGKPLPAAPPRLEMRAKALVGFEADRKRTSLWSLALGALLPSFDGGYGMQRGVMAGAALILAAVGFMMGGGLGHSYTYDRYASAQTTTTNPLGTDTTGQLNDLFTDAI